MRHLVAIAILLSFPSVARSNDQCPFIRPPGLKAEQVDSVVLATYAQALRTEPSALNTARTVKGLDGTENAILTYSFATLALGENLGFDAIKTFFEAAKSKGAAQPFDSLTLAEIQSLARGAYFSGVDAEPPSVAPGVVYKVHSTNVPAPQPADGWRLVRCGGEHVAYQRQSAQGMATAAVRVAAVPRYSSKEGFLDNVTRMLASSVPDGHRARDWQPVLVSSTPTPCADATLTADGNERIVAIRARICYASEQAPFGYAIMFGQNIAKSGVVRLEEAEAFIRSVVVR